MIKNVLEYLEESASRFPEKVAFADENSSCTFSEIYQQSQRVGTFLAQKITPGFPVPVWMEKGTKTIAAFMGILQAGGFYVLLDTKQPVFRIHQILDTLEAKVMISSRDYES